ncbi:chondroitinase, partial [Pseudoxanthomonas sp. SGD-10]
ISKEQLALFSNFYRNVYLKTLRSKYIDFNVEGRGVTRKNILVKNSEKYRVRNAKLIDPANTSEWDEVLMRLDSVEGPGYKIKPYHQHFWKADYTLHVRPHYSFNVRIASNRTNRSEAGNRENLYGRYLSDGATNIQVNGPEYFNIMPIWEWDKIPGTTSVDNAEDLLLDKNWGHLGDNEFAGGVSDQVYGATAYQLEYDNVYAKKAWFFFDDEVVALGTDINSKDERNVTTTLNQAWLRSKVSSSAGELNDGEVKKLDLAADSWLYHDGVGYIFPKATALNVSTQTQTGSWHKINNPHSKDPVSGAVFKTWIDHGRQPQNADYAYVVLPGLKDASALKKYKNQIDIVRNDKAVQAVYHQKLNIIQVVFYTAATVNVNGLEISVDKPTVLMVKALKGNQKEILVADPLQKETSVKVSLKDIKSGAQKDLNIALPTGPYKGSTTSEKVSL